MSNVTPANASNTYKQQIVDIVVDENDQISESVISSGVVARKAKTVFFTQSGVGSQSGTSESNALAASAFDAYEASPGDRLTLCGTITSPLTVGTNHQGVPGMPVQIDGAIGTPVFLNPGSSVTAITVNPIQDVQIHNILIGTCLDGIYGFAHWNGLKNILVNNVRVQNPTDSGIVFNTGALSFIYTYAKCKNVVVRNCQVDTAGLFGAFMCLNSDRTCGIEKTRVKGAATAGGSHWGMYISGFTKQYSATNWSGSNPYTISLVDLGWASNVAPYQSIEQLAIVDTTTLNINNKIHFTKGTYGALNNWEFGQNGVGGTIQIKLPAPDASINTRQVLTSPIIQDGWFMRDNHVSGTQGTEGTGLGSDVLAANGLIHGNITHDNIGAGVSLSYSRGIDVINNKSFRNAKDFTAWNCGGVLSMFAGNQGAKATGDSFNMGRSEQNMLDLINNEAYQAGGYDFNTQGMGTVISGGNRSFGCVNHNSTLCSQFT